MYVYVHAWNLTRFDRVLYVDADVMMLHPADGLWNASLGVRQLYGAVHTLSLPSAKYRGANETGGCAPRPWLYPPGPPPRALTSSRSPLGTLTPWQSLLQ